MAEMDGGYYYYTLRCWRYCPTRGGSKNAFFFFFSLTHILRYCITPFFFFS